MKYVIGKDDGDMIYPLAFPEELSHSAVAEGAFKGTKIKPVSAGFYEIGVDGITIHGASTSLLLKPFPEDQLILLLFLIQGLCGLQLQNQLTFMEITGEPLRIT